MSNIKIISWNVNGLQGILKKDEMGVKTTLTNLKRIGAKSALQHMIGEEDPDILCLQEIKCSDKFDHNSVAAFARYPYKYVNHATGGPSSDLTTTSRKGYSGVLVMCKSKPLKVTNNLEVAEKEGRLITIEYESFIVVNVYVPNSGVAIRQKDGRYTEGLRRLEWRIGTWEVEMRKYISSLLLLGKTLIVTGDFNIIHSSDGTALDSYRPIVGRGFAGATTEEKKAFEELLGLGMIDTFRYCHPKDRKISWHYTSDRNKGYRLDYNLVARGEIDRVIDSDILTQYLGSDHSPIVLLIKV